MTNIPLSPGNSSSFTLRSALSGDLPAIMALECAAFSEGERDELETYRHKIDHAASFLLAWTENGELVGHFIAETWPDGWLDIAQRYQLGDAVSPADASTLFVESICIDPLYHGKGLSKQLLEQGLATSLQQDCGKSIQRIVAAIRADNHASLALFRRLGFIDIFDRDQFFPSCPETRMIFFKRDVDP